MTGRVALCLALLPALARAEPDSFGFGDGHAGSLNNNISQTVNDYAQVTQAIHVGDTTVTVDAAPTLAAGDLVLIVQMAGATASSGDATPFDLGPAKIGQWELARVASTTSTVVTLRAKMIQAFDAGVTQLVTVPEYTTVSLGGSGAIVPAAWDGTSGGIVAFLCQGAFDDKGSVDASGMGFRGGKIANDTGYVAGCTLFDYASNRGADKGEGITGSFGASVGGYGNLANGAGGGDCHNSPGGGGGSAGAGGQGGTSWSGDGRRDVGGRAGVSLANPQGRLLFGGGGGAGHENDLGGTSGGAGGGIVFIRAGSMTGGGRISADGATASDSSNDGPGGGGAGGTIYLRLGAKADCGGASASGGNGGNINDNNYAGGGGGGGGYALFQAGSGNCTAAVDPGTRGVAGGNANGAASGSAGVLDQPPGGFKELKAPAITSPSAGALLAVSKPTIAGTMAGGTPAGAVAVIYSDGLPVGRGAGSGNAFSIVPAVALADGPHTLTAAAEFQGAQGPQSASVAITIDTTPPAAPVFTSPPATVTTTTPTLAGTAEPDSKVSLLVDGVALATVTAASGTGDFSYLLTAGQALAVGAHTATGHATDLAGNVGADGTVAFAVVTGGDAGAPDAAPVDGGGADAAPADGGGPDAAASDAGGGDSGAGDAASPDSGGKSDAGPSPDSGQLSWLGWRGGGCSCGGEAGLGLLALVPALRRRRRP